MIYWVRPRYEHLGWKSITFQSGYKPEKEKTYKIEISQRTKFSERNNCFLPLIFDGEWKTCARCWWLWWWQFISEFVFVSFVRRFAGRDPRRGKQAALSHVRNVAKSYEKLRNLSCVLERTSSALLVSQNKDCLCCAGLPAQAALADSSVFHKNYTRSLERESISAQFFLSNSFRIVFRIRLMLKMNDDGWVSSGSILTKLRIEVSEIVFASEHWC